MMRPPKPRKQIYNLYWEFTAKRQEIFMKRFHGEPPPWSDDPILREFKFCNVFRAADRVSQYLIRNIAYNGDTSSPEDTLFQILAFRTFSKENTWRMVIEYLKGPPTIANLKDGSFLAALEEVRRRSGGLYTGAFILCATAAYGHRIKHRNYVDLFKDMFIKNSLGSKLLDSRGLQEVYELLHQFPLMGDFMSYQISIDLNYSKWINFCENDFTKPGPGALRGIKKVFLDTGDLSDSDIINWMVDQQKYAFPELGLSFAGLWGRPLHAIDCQNLFCELDKYCRQAVPMLTSDRKRIKSRFTPSAEGLAFFFPPKWQISMRSAENPSSLPAQRQLLPSISV